ncbi:MAG: DUF7793 family protein [Bacteroidia bacterium]
MKTVITPLAEISFDKETTILHIKIFENVGVNLENAKKHFELVDQLIGQEPHFALVDATHHYIIEKEAWEHASKVHILSNRKAIAHYNSSKANNLTTMLFKALYKSSIPFEIFKTQNEAIEWFKTIQ